MANGDRFRKSTVRILFELKEKEHLICDSCESEVFETEEMWIFFPNEGTHGETCCLSCASTIVDDKEPFEVDQ